MHLAHYLRLVHTAENRLADAYDRVAADHGDEPDIAHLTRRLAAQCREREQAIEPFADDYAKHAPDEPDRLHSDLFGGTRTGGLGLLRDLHDLQLMATECEIAWTVIGQAAYGARDEALLALVGRSEQQVRGQLRWLRSRIKQAAPQALVVAA
jgi:hypothetical protein